jgi:hypothetical protein
MAALKYRPVIVVGVVCITQWHPVTDPMSHVKTGYSWLPGQTPGAEPPAGACMYLVVNVWARRLVPQVDLDCLQAALEVGAPHLQVGMVGGQDVGRRVQASSWDQ